VVHPLGKVVTGVQESLAIESSSWADGRLNALSAIVPVHDEEATVSMVVSGLIDVLPRVARTWELIVVDDGSADGTARVLDELAPRTRKLVVVRHACNRGYGAALRSGFAAARYDHVFYTDGDGQFDPAQLVEAVGALAGADGVVGYRLHRADPLLRRVNTAAWNGIVRALFGLRTRDLNCAFKLLPRAVLDPQALSADGAVISAEILARAERAGCTFVEVPVQHWPRVTGRSSGARPSVVLRAAWELPRLYWQLRREGRA